MRTAIESFEKLIKKYRHAWVLLYGFIYFPWFTYLERHNASEYFFIHSPLDDYIPVSYTHLTLPTTERV